MRRILESVARPNRHTPPPLQLTLTGEHRIYAVVEFVGDRNVGLALVPGGAALDARIADIEVVLVLDEAP